MSSEAEVSVPAIFPEVTAPAPAEGGRSADLSLLMELQLPCYFELGSARISVGELLGVTKGSVIMLDRMVGESGRFMVADKHFADGEVVAFEGGYYGVRITRVVARLGGAAG